MTPTPSTGGDARADLLERLKAATAGDRSIEIDLHNAFLGRDHLENAFQTDGSRIAPYTRSLDAALALVERVLPGWLWSTGVDINGQRYANVMARFGAPIHDAKAPTAPLAVLIALLSALPADSLGQEETGK